MRRIWLLSVSNNLSLVRCVPSPLASAAGVIEPPRHPSTRHGWECVVHRARDALGCICCALLGCIYTYRGFCHNCYDGEEFERIPPPSGGVRADTVATIPKQRLNWIFTVLVLELSSIPWTETPAVRVVPKRAAKGSRQGVVRTAMTNSIPRRPGEIYS